MTTVGKILVVLHLVLSIMFMAFAGAVFTAQTNWRAAELKTSALLTAEKNKNRDQAAETEKNLADSTAKFAKLENDIVTLKGQNIALNTEVKTLSSENKTLRTSVDQQRDQAALTTTEAVERKKEADLQREINGGLYLSREELAQKLNETEDKRFALELKVQQFSEKYDQLFSDFKTMRQFLASKDLPTDPKQMLVQTAAAPPLDGKIMEVRKLERGSGELIEISLGSDSGLVVGNRLTAFNDKGYLGVIRLTLVEADRSVGVVLGQTRAKNAAFKVGDGVTTRY